MNEPPSKALSDWLDDVNSDPADLDEQLAGESCVQAAESLLIYGLLSDRGRQDEARDGERICACMQAIETEELPTPGSLSSPPLHNGRARRLALLTSALTIAAAVVVMIIVLGTQQNGPRGTQSWPHF